MVKSFNNTRNPPFLFQSQPCSHFLIKGYSFFVNVYIRLRNKVWFIPAHCDIKICNPSLFKFSFKSLKNIECGLAHDSNAGNILAEIIVRDHICLIFKALYANFDQKGHAMFAMTEIQPEEASFEAL